MYEFVMRAKGAYSALQDDLSRKLFWARLRNDFQHDGYSVLELASLRGGLTEEQRTTLLHWKETIRGAQDSSGKLVVYGTSITGRTVAELLRQEGIDILCFCGRGAHRFQDGLMGKPVVPPEWLAQNAKAQNVYVVIAAVPTHGSYDEIMDFLKSIQLPRDHILDFYTAPCPAGSPPHYFEFPDLIPRGRAYIDGGCADGGQILQFAQYTGGDYSKIFAFDPDHTNYLTAQRAIQEAKLQNVELIEAGLSAQSGVTASFGGDPGCGHIQTEREPTAHVQAVWEKRRDPHAQQEPIALVRIDDVVKDHPVGMIKMDIEGSEYDALQGAEQTIRRDKPLLAISVYHLTGDVLAIMDLCRRLVPEYRFWLRQYDCVPCETILYASV